MRNARVAILLVLLALFVVCMGSGPIQGRLDRTAISWILHCQDDDIDAAAELLTELDTTFAQLAAADNVYVVSSSSADTTQTVYVSGINNANGKKVTVSFTLTGDTVTAASSITFRYIDQLWSDAECAGTVSLYREDGVPTLINSIEIGSLSGDVSQHFSGAEYSYVQSWWATNVANTDAIFYELRHYPDDADCLDDGDGFQVLDRILLAVDQYSCDPHVFGDGPGSGIRLPAGGWVTVHATGGSTDESGTVTVIGYDARR